MSASDFHSRLLDWFDRHGRHDLPWQHPRTPYRVWISEIMLQQTQVATVIGYFNRFMQRFPSLDVLAAAPVDEVLALWSGLGYYARARNLHAAAQIMAQQGVPETRAGWQALPSVGPSTAAAIMAQAFDVPETILDGNVKRVLARHAGIDRPIEQASTIQALYEVAKLHTPQTRVADYTQAIMDLGATLCTRHSPGCSACPVSADCVAFASNRVESLPVRRRRQPVPTRRAVFMAIEDEAERLMLIRRPPTGIWGGLWCLPEYIPADDCVSQEHTLDSAVSGKQAKDNSGQQSMLSIHRLKQRGPTSPLTTFEHRFTHYLLDARIDHMVVSRTSSVEDNPDVLWLPLIELAARAPLLGLPKPMSRFLSDYPALKSSQSSCTP
ncbi:A/G-specific adenine glycosylase [Halothiobacillus neapolitanus]|uniref:Adenine DNA glycosylase n=1 Tax=Halothiobacillus neapolitanus (strain ATCC 23641 / DSM 15147 / CIP 104769 / NCIMB 8539 / c2) TaxID=555778 RepID=D0L1V0_HALNC|nr:A/G-specific adenine glycosylase [Halothiobacillus neapolitanus]ACX96673.1 A/G-specific adenine glycosylase [Halothiobacillus neapolitanus c2]TDN65217.1 A/G-specific DNA-adenine glycosylase [Halothiobacillus neapolitanus]